MHKQIVFKCPLKLFFLVTARGGGSQNFENMSATLSTSATPENTLPLWRSIVFCFSFSNKAELPLSWILATPSCKYRQLIIDSGNSETG